MKKKFTEIKNLSDPHVPERLGQMVAYLNKLLVADPVLITAMLDHEFLLPHDVAAFIEDIQPNVALRQLSSGVALTALGLLGGFVNSESFRLFAEFEGTKENQGNIFRFGAYFVTEVEEGDVPTPSGSA